jgi:hypothetical protein
MTLKKIFHFFKNRMCDAENMAESTNKRLGGISTDKIPNNIADKICG